jgi:hypothetical protein
MMGKCQPHPAHQGISGAYVLEDVIDYHKSRMLVMLRTCGSRAKMVTNMYT